MSGHDAFFDFVLADQYAARCRTVLPRRCEQRPNSSAISVIRRCVASSYVSRCAADPDRTSAMTMSLARSVAPAIRVVAVARSLMETYSDRMWNPAAARGWILNNPLKLDRRARKMAAVFGLATTMTTLWRDDPGRAAIPLLPAPVNQAAEQLFLGLGRAAVGIANRVPGRGPCSSSWHRKARPPAARVERRCDGSPARRS